MKTTGPRLQGDPRELLIRVGTHSNLRPLGEGRRHRMRMEPGLAALWGVGPVLPQAIPSPVPEDFSLAHNKVGIKHLLHLSPTRLGS